MTPKQAFCEKWFGGLNVRHWNGEEKLPLRWYPNYALVRVPRFGVVEIFLGYANYVVPQGVGRATIGAIYDHLRVVITHLGIGKVADHVFAFNDLGPIATPSLGVFTPQQPADARWVLFDKESRQPFSGGFLDSSIVEIDDDIVHPRTEMLFELVESHIVTWLGEYGEFHPRQNT